MRKKKKKNNKRRKIVFLVIIGIILIFVIYNNIFNNKNKLNIKKEDIINSILSYNIDSIDEAYLKWIMNNYGENSLNKLNKYLKNNEYSNDIWHDLVGYSDLILRDFYNSKYDSMDNVRIIEKKSSKISFVGDISLADNFDIIPAYDERNKGVLGILSEDVINIMKSADLMVANNEFTISDRGEPLPNKYYTFRASPKRLSIYEEMGVDLVTLANNHIYDFGKDAFLDSLDALNKIKMPYIGAGKNIEEAKKPYYFIINGYKVAFINATRAEKYILTPEATETSEGVFRCYDPEPLSNAIKELKKNSDFVIALIHWGKEDSHDLEQVQIDTGKLYIDSGADIIIGTHAHTLQGIEFYNNKFIAYNLGDFIFNDDPEETAILSITINDDKTLSYEIIPCLQKNMYTDILKNEDKINLLNKIQNWSINANIDEEGNIKIK